MASIASVSRVQALADFPQALLSFSRLCKLERAHFNGRGAKYVDGVHHLPDLVAAAAIADLHLGIARRQPLHRIGDGFNRLHD